MQRGPAALALGHLVLAILPISAIISGLQHDAMRRIEEATMPRDDEYMPWTTR